MCMIIFPHVCKYTMYIPGPLEASRRYQIPEIGVVDGCVPLGRYWEWNLILYKNIKCF